MYVMSKDKETRLQVHSIIVSTYLSAMEGYYKMIVTLKLGRN